MSTVQPKEVPEQLRFNLDFVRARALADELEANMKRMGIYQGKPWSYANRPGLPA